jgi:tetratricopeptide (TPR) repeat protein
MKQKEIAGRLVTVVITTVISCGTMWAQAAPSQQNRVDQQATQNSNTGYNQQNNNHPTTPQDQPAAPPHSKAQPQAKSQEEFNGYQAVAAKADPSEMEAAADDFAKKYPNSELLVAIYSSVMHKYQNINNSDKVLETGHKILKLDPDNIPALAVTSYVLAESTRDTDLDRDQKYAEGLKNAQKVVKDIDTLVVPPSLTPEQVAGLKAYLISMADSAMGYIEMNQKLYPASEEHFKAAIDANKGVDADPVVYLRLAVVQDYQKKYNDAMTTIDKALQVAESQKNDPVTNMAKSEKDRLSKLVAGAGAPPKPAAIKQ